MALDLSKIESIGLGFNPFKKIGKQLALAKTSYIQSIMNNHFWLKPKTISTLTTASDTSE